MKESCLYKMKQLDKLADILESHQRTRFGFTMSNFVRRSVEDKDWNVDENLVLRGKVDSEWKNVEIRFHTVYDVPEITRLIIYVSDIRVEHAVIDTEDAGRRVIAIVEKGRMGYEVEAAIAMMP